MKSLASAKVGQQVTVKSIDSDDETWIKRLRALGIYPGVKIKIIRKALTGSPIHVSINTTELAIRQKDAENIHIF